MSQTTTDTFLGGRVTVRQPKVGFRAGTDAVLLAAACPAKSGEHVLDLGCGVGVAALCVLARVPGVQLTGLELQDAYASLARENAAALPFSILQGDISAPPPALSAQSFDHVICNPPYFPQGAGSSAEDPSRETALREDTPLADWVDLATRRLKPKGTLTMILRTDRLDALFRAMDARLGSHVVLPLASRGHKPAHRILCCSRKGGRAGTKLLPPLVLHSGDQHTEDGDNFTQNVSQILRGGAEIAVN